MRLEQRIGRVDRIGQEHIVRALNFVFEESVEFRVREVLEEKLKPKSYKRVTREIDCSLLKLFMDKVIKWTDVQKLVYSDCEL
jgi:SNF2 family DNA or RNA helicase